MAFAARCCHVISPSSCVGASHSIHQSVLSLRIVTSHQFLLPLPLPLLPSLRNLRRANLRPRPPNHPQRPFTTTCHLSKKGGKGGKSPPSQPPPPSPSSPAGSDDPADPYNFNALHSSIGSAIERLRGELAKLQRGVRIQPDVIEQLPVQLKYTPAGSGGRGGTEKRTETVKVEDLATVVPKGGRMMIVMVGDESHVKPILSALQSPPPPSSSLPPSLSLTPTVDPHNPLQLTIPLPPPTHASRLSLVDSAKQFRDHASQAIRNARGEAQRRLKEMQKRKVVPPDECFKALKEMEGHVEKGNKGVKEAFEEGERRIMGE